MQIRVSGAGGPGRPKVVVERDVTIDGQGLEIFLEELDQSTGIKKAQLGQAKNGDLYLIATSINGSWKTIRINAAGPRVVGDVAR